LAPGAGIGVQSARNPKRSPNPPQRQSVIGVDGARWVWCYSRAGSQTGWVRFDDIEYARDLSKPPLSGPARLDFEVGRTHPKAKKPSGCGKPSPTKPLRRVKSVDTYLRYSPRGTAFHHLHEGDLVRLLLVNGPQGFAFCEVRKVGCNATAKVGSRGWILQNSLESV
jgi:hypothetical protein